MFLLSEDQLNKIAAVLLEVPAKVSLPALDILRSLQRVPEQQNQESVKAEDA